MVGNVLRAFFFIPVLANRAEEVSSDSEETKLEHLNAHLMIEFKPREQIKAHKRTERTITTFASKLLFGGSDRLWLVFPVVGGVAAAGA